MFRKEEKSPILINQRLMKPASCYPCMFFFNIGSIEETKSLGMCLIFVYVDFVLHLGRFGQFDFSVALHIYEKKFSSLLMTEFGHPVRSVHFTACVVKCSRLLILFTVL